MATMYDPKKTYTAPSAPRVVNDSDAGVARISQQAPPARGQEGYDPYGGLQGGGAGGYSPTQIQDLSRINQATPSYTAAPATGTYANNIAVNENYQPVQGGLQANEQWTDTAMGEAAANLGQDTGVQGDGGDGSYFDEGGEGAGGASDEILAKLMEYIGGYEQDRDLINRQMDERLAGGMRAMGGQLGASGFGASGAGVSLAGDVARQNEMARQQALRDSDEAFYRRLLGGHGAMLGERGMLMDEDYYNMIKGQIMDQMNYPPGSGEGGGGGGGGGGDGFNVADPSTWADGAQNFYEGAQNWWDDTFGSEELDQAEADLTEAYRNGEISLEEYNQQMQMIYLARAGSPIAKAVEATGADVKGY